MNKYADGGIVSQFKRSGVQGLSNGGLPMVPLGALQGQAYQQSMLGGLSGGKMAKSTQTAPAPKGSPKGSAKVAKANKAVATSAKATEGLNAVTGGLVGVQMAIGMLTPTIDENSSSTAKATAFVMNSMSSLVGTITIVQAALALFGKQLTMDSVKKFFKTFKMGDIKDMLTGKGGAIKQAIGSKVGARVVGFGKNLKQTGGKMVGQGMKMGGKAGDAMATAGKKIG